MEKTTVDAFTFDMIRGSICHVTWKGEASEAGIRALREFGNAAAKQLGDGQRGRALIDAREATGVSRGARKQLQELGRDKPWDRVTFVGVRREVKVMLELITKALQLMKIDIAEVVFVDTPEQGLAWLERE